jgi:hypothetical protein
MTFRTQGVATYFAFGRSKNPELSFLRYFPIVAQEVPLEVRNCVIFTIVLIDHAYLKPV